MKLAHIIAALKLGDIVRCRTLRRVEIFVMSDLNREIGGVGNIAKWIEDGFLEASAKSVVVDVDFEIKGMRRRRG
jgi:hypothetical protein